MNTCACMKWVAFASCSDDMYSLLAFQDIKRHSIIVVCTIKHPKNDDTISYFEFIYLLPISFVTFV